MKNANLSGQYDQLVGDTKKDLTWSVNKGKIEGGGPEIFAQFKNSRNKS